MIVDAAQRVLLFATNPDASSIWTLPGGPVASGENAAAAVRRILHSATGQHVGSLTGPLTATRRATTATASGGRDLYYLCPVEALRFSRGDALTGGVLEQARWWTREELDTAAPNTSPRNLTSLVYQHLWS